MSRQESIQVVQAGLSGPSNEMFRAITAHENNPIELEAIATASRMDLVGKRLEDTEFRGAHAHNRVPIISLDTAINGTNSDVVYSGLQTQAAAEYEDELAVGRLVVTNAGANRMRNTVALYNAYLSHEDDQAEELFASRRKRFILAGGNCGSIPLSIALQPINQALGITGIQSIETLQGWSGAGKTEVPREYKGEVIPILGDEKQKLETEPQKFLGTMAMHADFVSVAHPKRGPWLHGHHIVSKIRVQTPTTQEEVIQLLKGMRAPSELKDVHYRVKGKSYAPQKNPINITKNPLLRKTTTGVDTIVPTEPMRVTARVIDVESPHNDIINLVVTGHNLILGAAGSSVMNIIYAQRKGYLDRFK